MNQRWLDPNKQIIKHFKVSSPYIFSFGVKFYVPDPIFLQEEYTRYQFFLQLRCDLAEGQLLVTKDVAVHLAGLHLQSELGPYCPTDHALGYINEFHFIPKQSHDFEQLAHDWHVKLAHLVPATAELEYINICRNSDYYGAKLKSCKDSQNRPVHISVAANGISEFKDQHLTILYKWDSINKINYKKRNFTLELKSYFENSGSQGNGQKAVTYIFSTIAESKVFWQNAVSCHAFFRIPDSAGASIGNLDIDNITLSGNSTAPTITMTMPSILQCLTSKRNHGLFRWLSFRGRRESDNTNSIGGLSRTMSTLRDLRRKTKALDRGFVRSSSSFSRRRSTSRLSNKTISSRGLQGASTYASGILSPTSGSVFLGSTANSQNELPKDRHNSRASLYRNLPPVSQPSTRVRQPSGRYSPTTVTSNPQNPRNSITSSNYVYKPGNRPTEIPIQKFPNTTRSEESKSQSNLALNLQTEDTATPRITNTSPQQSLIHSKSQNLNDSKRESRPIIKKSEIDSNSQVKPDQDDTDNQKYWQSRRQQSLGRVPSSSWKHPRSSSVSGSASKKSNLSDVLQTGRNPNREENRSSGINSLSLQQNEPSPIETSAIMSPVWSIISDYGSDPSVTTVRIKPDSRGRFGFNVKGGANHRTPVIVSRVGENLPADVCIPKLCEGDQILVINGQDIAPLSHEQVINLIRSTKETDAELEMIVRPRIYNTEDAVEETGGPSVPDSGDAPPLPPRPPPAAAFLSTGSSVSVHHPNAHSSITPVYQNNTNGLSKKNGTGSRLSTVDDAVIAPTRYHLNNLSVRKPQNGQSVVLVAWHTIPSNEKTQNPQLFSSIKTLETNLLIGQAEREFLDMYKKKSGYTTSVSKANENSDKNRYRDILPYDQTRVHLLDSSCDYINANHVNVECLSSHTISQYIAAQGPLPNTCADFWLMCWEQQTPLIVMLTTIFERGRVKCHQYWPEDHETIQFKYGSRKNNFPFEIHVKTVSTKITNGIAEREFCISRVKLSPASSQNNSLTDSKLEEHRRIIQLQYSNWPDHGTPENPKDLINFVRQVKSLRGLPEKSGSWRKFPKVVVHCSAGIGRTGVFITMETAMDLIDSCQPVFPLQILRSLRDQRAMLVQTVAQYQFVCEAILKYFES